MAVCGSRQAKPKEGTACRARSRDERTMKFYDNPAVVASASSLPKVVVTGTPATTAKHLGAAAIGL
jgi:hypothetical protein